MKYGRSKREWWYLYGRLPSFGTSGTNSRAGSGSEAGQSAEVGSGRWGGVYKWQVKCGYVL